MKELPCWTVFNRYEGKGPCPHEKECHGYCVYLSVLDNLVRVVMLSVYAATLWLKLKIWGMCE